MIRTQIQLTEEQTRVIKEWAAREGISMAEVIRRAVERLRLAKQEESAEKWRRASALIGAFDEGPIDVSANHDRYLEQDYDSCQSSPIRRDCTRRSTAWTRTIQPQPVAGQDWLPDGIG